MTTILCAWCGCTIEIETDADHGGLCPACEEQIASADTAWREKEEQP